MKTLSVLIAAFEAQNWIEACLDGVFAQTLPAGWQMQVILGIDGCQQTQHTVQQLNYPDLFVLNLRDNVGTYICFNTLMQYATGELICRFDADDVMLDDYLATQIHALERGVDMTMTWSIYTDADLQASSYVMAHDVYHPENGLRRKGAEGQFMVKRQVWRHLGGFRAWRCGADTDFFKRLRYAGFRHRVIEEFLYYRRTHAQSLTAHPASNFQSAYRLRIMQMIEDLDQQYQQGQLAVYIDAESVGIDECH